MSFNRRGPDRRPDRPDRSDRPPQRRGDWQPRERGGDWQPRDRGGDRPYGGRDRSPAPRRTFDRGADEGGMSIRLDPRRLGTLKQLAGEAGVRPGDLVRQWVEERIDASRTGAGGSSLAERMDAIEARLAALESAPARTSSQADARAPEPQAKSEPLAGDEGAVPGNGDAPVEAPQGRTRSPRTASARPSEPRVGLHDEMIAVIAERGPLTAGELAQAIAERGRYAPPRSGKPLDAATVSQRASNPTYRSRFVRSEGRIGLSQAPEEG